MFDRHRHRASMSSRLLTLCWVGLLALPGSVAATGSDDDNVAVVEGKAISREALMAEAQDQLEEVENELLREEIQVVKDKCEYYQEVDVQPEE